MKAGLSTKRKLILLAMLSLLVLWGRAQTNLVFYNSNDQFNSQAFNPAFLEIQSKFTFSIFPLSGMSVGYNNQEVVKGMLMDALSGSLTQNKLTEIFKDLLKQDLFSQRFETPLFSFGYNSLIGSFNFRINEIEQIRTSLKNDFTEFINNPEFQTIVLNQPQNLYANVAHYREYSLGYAREIIEKKLSVGLRAKIYFGKSSLFSEVQGQVTGNSSKYFLRTTGPIKTSSPLDFTIDNDSIVTGATPTDKSTPMKYLFNPENIGVGMDFGFSYQVSSKVQISASAVDFGKINWKNNLNTMNLVGKYEITKYISVPGNDFITIDPSFYTDSLSFNHLFKSRVDSTSKYSTKLPTSFYAGLQYQIDPSIRIGLVDRYVKSKGMDQNSISLSVNYEANKKLTIISGYSAIGKSYYNIPFAVIYNWSGGQWYLGTDNLLSFIIPSKSDYAGIAFGTCIYLFKPKVKYEQKEYLPFYKEKKHNTIK